MVTKWQHLLFACTGLHYGYKGIAFIEHLDTLHRQVFGMIAKGQHLLYIRTLASTGFCYMITKRQHLLYNWTLSYG